MLGRRMWKRRAVTQTASLPTKTEFHVPPSVAVATVIRVISALHHQGLLNCVPEELVIIPLASSRHMYHKDNKDL